jgi:nicotinamidase-related amidase
MSLILLGFTNMIQRFGLDACLLLIDVQVGVDDLTHWGGKNGRRNNHGAEECMLSLLLDWRKAGLPVAFTLHDSLEQDSPLKFGLPGGSLKEGFAIDDGDICVRKHVNSGFVGTSLDEDLRTRGISRLVVVGFFTNMCVETTVRMAGNMGYDTYLIPEGCGTTNRLGPDGADFDPDIVHSMTVANLHGEFCTAISLSDATGLLSADASHLMRVQGNE